LWIALVEEAGELKRPRGKGESRESLRYRERAAAVVKRAAARVNRIYRRTRTMPAARLGVP